MRRLQQALQQQTARLYVSFGGFTPPDPADPDSSGWSGQARPRPHYLKDDRL